MKLNRRHFLKLGGSSAVLSALPLSLQKALAKGTTRGSLESVEHVVILSQENRSFDHYLGTLNGVRGFADPHPLRKPDGTSVFAQNNLNGKAIFPFRLHSKTTDGQCKIDVTHSWESGLKAANKGRMDQWIAAKDIYSMSYYNQEDIAFHYAMSEAFTTCDHFFCSVNTSTSPNRLYLMTGSNGQGLWPGNASMANDESVPFTWTTYAERLQAAGISWKMYQEEDNFDDNALAWFKNFQEAKVGSDLYERGMKKRGRDAFAKDVANDTLPTVSWIIAPESLSEHPFSSPPQAGADYSKGLLDALASNPKVWAKTVFIYTYDENGGIFDHVVPPSPPVDSKNDWTIDAHKNVIPLSLGHRIPTWLISPWSVGGSVYSQTCDLTSTLRFLEKFTGVKETNITDWRRNLCGDLVDGFDFRASGYGFPKNLPDTAPLAKAALFCKDLPAGLPNGEKAAPSVQAGGSRVLRPVAVQPNVNATVDASKKIISIHLENSGTTAAAFDIHSYTEKTFDPVFVTMLASTHGTRVLQPVDMSQSKYDYSIHGPNSFYRRFAGDFFQNQLKVSMSLNLTDVAVDLVIENTSGQAITITLGNKIKKTQTSYVIDSLKKLSVRPVLTDRWYDFSVRIKAQPEAVFSYEYCGHIEGQVSRTYPKGSL